MIVQTKFSIGDRVFPINRGMETVTRDCERCKGKGELALVEGGSLPCPNRYVGRESCSGGKVSLGTLQPWALSRDSIGAVGQVRVLRTTYHVEFHGDSNVNEYMLYPTGVGSGRIWKEADLFATEEEAEGECDRRNAVVLAEERKNILAGESRDVMERRFADAIAPEEVGVE